jgi:tetratricopeptide (TPR) repeat protein
MAALGRADYPVAKAAFQKCVELTPDNAEAWCYLGIALSFKEPELAAPALDRALSIDPRHHGALYWRAELHWIEGEPRSAAELLRRLNEIVPDVSHNLARMGFAYLSAGDTEAGMAALNAAVDAGGGLASVHTQQVELRRAFYLDALGRREEALRLVQTVNGPGCATWRSSVAHSKTSWPDATS